MKRLIVLFGVFAFALLLTSSASAAPRKQIAYSADELISCWDLDEESGTRADAYGANHLTDVNTTGFAGSGVIGKAAAFVKANNDYLSIVDNDSLSFGAGERFTIAAWYISTSNARTQIYGKGTTEYYLEATVGADSYNNGSVNFNAKTGDGSTAVQAVSGAPLKINEWHFVIVTYDGAYISMRVDDTLRRETAHAVDLYDSSNPFLIGKLTTGSSYGIDGYIDVVTVWNRALAPEEELWIYNNGFGRGCAELIDPGLTEPYDDVRTTTGRYFRLERSASYGDMVLFGLGGLILVVILVYIVVRLVREWLP